MRRIHALHLVAAILLTSGASASTQRVASASIATSARGDTLSGRFILQFTNGREVPFSTENAGAVYTLDSASIAFKPNGSFIRSTTVTVRQAGDTFAASRLFHGTFVYSASTHAVSLRDSDGVSIGGTIVNDTMTLAAGRDTLVFYRQW
jgi:hypothetical protein